MLLANGYDYIILLCWRSLSYPECPLGAFQPRLLRQLSLSLTDVSVSTVQIEPGRKSDTRTVEDLVKFQNKRASSFTRRASLAPKTKNREAHILSKREFILCSGRHHSAISELVWSCVHVSLHALASRKTTLVKTWVSTDPHTHTHPGLLESTPRIPRRCMADGRWTQIRVYWSARREPVVS